jgi:hypothetical protein
VPYQVEAEQRGHGDGYSLWNIKNYCRESLSHLPQFPLLPATGTEPVRIQLVFYCLFLGQYRVSLDERLKTEYKIAVA